MQKQYVRMFIVLLIILSLAGCTPFRRPTPTPQTPTPTPGVPGTETTPPGQMQEQLPTADRVTRIVNAMSEVKMSSALIIGNVALVGVDLRDKLSGDQENRLKEQISTDTKRQIPELAEVWVTSDPDLLTRIRDLAARISRGEPVTGLFDEIDTIVKKLQPQAR